MIVMILLLESAKGHYLSEINQRHSLGFRPVAATSAPIRELIRAKAKKGKSNNNNAQHHPNYNCIYYWRSLDFCLSLWFSTKPIILKFLDL